MNRHYRSGSHAAYVGPTHLLVVDAPLEGVVAQVGRHPDPLALLRELSGGDLTGLPDFALIVAEPEQVRVFVRGAFGVSCGSDRIAAARVTTWMESVLDAPSGSSITVSTGAAADGPTLPVGPGSLVLVSEVSWTVDGSAAPHRGRDTQLGAMFDEQLEASEPEPEPSEIPGPEAEPVTDLESVSEPISDPDPTPEPPADPAATRFEGDDAFDAMFGATVHGRRPEDAAVRAPSDLVTPAVAQVSGVPEGTASVEPHLVVPGDHDGHTVTAAVVRRIRAEVVPASATGRERPPTARLTLSTGQVVTIDRLVVVGRSPRATQVDGPELPTLVVVDDDYISGTHVQLQFEGRSLVVTDRSRNGTVLTLPGHVPVRMTRDEPTVVTHGSRLSLSDDVSAAITIEGD